MKWIIVVFMMLLGGCATNDLMPLVGSTYESVDGTYLKQQVSGAGHNPTGKKKEDKGGYNSLLNSRAAIDQDLIDIDYLDKYLNGILAKLLAQWPLAVDQKVRVMVTTERSFNARATLNDIVLSMGILGDVESEDELAFVIAHELSHILLRHQDTNDYFAKQSVLVSKAANAAMLTAAVDDLGVQRNGEKFQLIDKDEASTQGKMEDAYRASLAVNRLSRDVINSAMARRDENEADLLGVDLMVKAGYSAFGYAKVLERLESSQVFTKQQLKQKKAEFQEVVTVLSSKKIPLEGNSLKSVVYLAANESATQMLQKLSERHGSPEDRKGDLAHYVKREYRKERKRQVKTKELTQNLRTGAGAYMLDKYWKASEALRAVEHGAIKQAEKLAREAVSGPTSGHAYPRLAFYSVRRAQGNEKKAISNLNMINRWDMASAQTFALAAQAYRRSGMLTEALDVLGKAESALGTKDPIYSELIAVYKAKGDGVNMARTLTECRKVKETNIVAQCHQAAGQPIPQKSLIEGNNLLKYIPDFVNL